MPQVWLCGATVEMSNSLPLETHGNRPRFKVSLPSHSMLRGFYEQGLWHKQQTKRFWMHVTSPSASAHFLTWQPTKRACAPTPPPSQGRQHILWDCPSKFSVDLVLLSVPASSLRFMTLWRPCLTPQTPYVSQTALTAPPVPTIQISAQKILPSGTEDIGIQSGCMYKLPLQNTLHIYSSVWSTVLPSESILPVYPQEARSCYHSEMVSLDVTLVTSSGSVLLQMSEWRNGVYLWTISQAHVGRMQGMQIACNTLASLGMYWFYSIKTKPNSTFLCTNPCWITTLANCYYPFLLSQLTGLLPHH